MQYNKKPVQHGEAFALIALALIDAKGKTSDLDREADRYRYSHPEVHAFLKAAVSEGTTTDANWAGPLSQYRAIADEFLAVVRARSILGRLPEARHVPLNVRAALEFEPSVVYWSAAGAPKPISRLTFSEMTSLAPRKASIIVVLSEELARHAQGGVSAMQRALVKHLAAGLDRALLDPSFGTSSSAPTSITNAGTVVSPSGTSATQIAADLESMAIAVAAASEFDSPIFVVSALTAAKLAAHRDTAGGAAFGNITVFGGTLIGIPVLVSNATQSADSPAQDNVVLFNQSSLVIGDDSEVIIAATDQASLQMDNAPSAGARSHVSLWQSNLIGLKVERFVNWTLARVGAAASLVVTF